MAMDAASVSCMFYGLQVYKSLFILFPCIHRAKEYAKQQVGCLMHLRHPSPKVAFQSRRAALTGAQQPFAA